MKEYIELLKSLISIPSVSRDEGRAADFLQQWMTSHGFAPHRVGNNLWCCAEALEDGTLPPTSKPVILLNAHIDTVKPAAGYTSDPFSAKERDGCIYGLGANDDGGSLVALLSAYKRLSERCQPYRLIFSASAEEEVSGKGGIECLFPQLGRIDLGVIGEPTGMNMAVGERGLMVLDCEAEGVSGHAAREEGVNAIYKALADIEWFRNYRFEKVSEFLGPVKMTVTQIEAGSQHNVIPDSCRFVVDVRSNGLYSNQEILDVACQNVACRVKERSTRLGSSSIPESHPIVRRGAEMSLASFGSPTMSNQALCSFTTIKIGPGDSARSHTADEYIRIDEIASGADVYVSLLDQLEI